MSMTDRYALSGLKKAIRRLEESNEDTEVKALTELGDQCEAIAFACRMTLVLTSEEGKKNCPFGRELDRIARR